MVRLIALVGLAFGLATSSAALAGERTITLAVKNMDCASCPFIVRKSLEGVPGVAKAEVSLKEKTAVVTFDDVKTNVSALTKATGQAGYPSAPKS